MFDVMIDTTFEKSKDEYTGHQNNGNTTYQRKKTDVCGQRRSTVNVVEMSFWTPPFYTFLVALPGPGDQNADA